MKRRRSFPLPVRHADASDALTALVTRARRMHARGDTRRSIVALREACMRGEQTAWLWTLYAARLAEAGRDDEAQSAFRHAIWLRRRQGDAARERTTTSLLARLHDAG